MKEWAGKNGELAKEWIFKHETKIASRTL